MFSLFQSKKEVLLSEIHTVHAGLHAAGESRMKYADSWTKFGQFVKSLVLTQNGDIESYMDRLISLFEQISESQRRLAAAEIRNSEDFRDVAERFSVVFRSNEEYIEAKRIFRELKSKLKDAIQLNDTESKKPTYEKNKAKLEANIEKLREQSRQQLEKTKATLDVLIQVREKYNKFKVRRFTQGWTLYGNALKVESAKEAELLGQVEELLNELKARLEGKELDTVTEALQNQLTQQPAPMEAMPEINDKLADGDEQITTNPQFDSYE